MLRILLPMAAVALTAFAHFAWLEGPSTLKPGSTARVRIGFAHELGDSESAISLDGLAVHAIAPSGAKAALKPVTDGKWVSADLAVKEAGVYRLYFTQDRGTMSQTTKGFKPGGRDVHPDAKKSMKMWRSAYAAAGAGTPAATPVGTELEIVTSRTAGGWELTVLRKGKPAAGATVGRYLPGTEDLQDLGKPDANGRLLVKPDPKGPMAVQASVSEAAPAGATYDTYELRAVVILK